METTETAEQIRRTLERISLSDRIAIADWLSDLNEREARRSGIREARAIYESDDPLCMTFEEFLEFEERSELRHEFVNGFVFAMSGPSIAHAHIVQNLALAFGNHLRRRGPCDVFSSHARLEIRRNDAKYAYYPDVVVDCRPDARGSNFIEKPRLIVEVLSPSTHLTDRREKLQNYILIDSVEEYVLIAQRECKVMIHRRAEGWRPLVRSHLDESAEFRSIELSVPLVEIYERVLDNGDTRSA